MPLLSSAARIAFWVSTIQGLLVLSWTVYVLFLPQLAAQAGIPARWVVWILVADQAIFVASDWASGLFADRLAKWVGRIGPAMVAAALISAGLFAAMPLLAKAGHRVPLLVAIGLWAAVSSFLRAPAFSLLGKIGGLSRKPGVISWSLVGTSCAGALGPVITTSLRQVHPLWPLGIASLALAVAGLMASKVEPLQGTSAAPAGRIEWPPVLMLVAIAFLAAFGMQLHTAFGALASHVTGVAGLWLPVFWIGFAAGLIVSARSTGSAHGLRWCAVAIVVGAATLHIAARTEDPVLLAIAQAITGGAWAIVLTTVLAVALQRGVSKGLASPLGLLMSSISLAAMSRLLLAGFGLQKQADWALWATLLWLIAAAGLLMHPWARASGERDDAEVWLDRRSVDAGVDR